jgi:Lon protease-like protein
MAETLPLFPLGTVLYPGMILPLHIFEDRYRRLVRDLLDGPVPRKFGVIAIRRGREVGEVPELYEIGCTAVIRDVTPHADGRFDLMTVGGDRFRLLSTDRSRSYLQGSVEPLPDQVDEPGALPAVHSARAAFSEYLTLLTERGGPVISVQQLPSEPVLLSYVIAAAMILDLPERQTLLEAAGARARLAEERALLRRELAMVGATRTRPAPDLRYTKHSPN